MIINVVDITSLERNLYLTTQLLSLDIPIIVSLNMVDKLKNKSFKIHNKTLEKRFGVSFIDISAAKNIGIEDLICMIGTKDFINAKKTTHLSSPSRKRNFTNFFFFNLNHNRYYAIKLLEDEKPFMDQVAHSQNKLKSTYHEDLYEVFAEQRYDLIKKIVNYATSSISKFEVRTDKIDKILLNKYLAIPLFMIIMLIIYSVSVGFIGSLSVELISNWVQSLSEYLNNSLINLGGASAWSRKFLTDWMGLLLVGVLC